MKHILSTTDFNIPIHVLLKILRENRYIQNKIKVRLQGETLGLLMFLNYLFVNLLKSVNNTVKFLLIGVGSVQNDPYCIFGRY